jgi:hypothetical protein
VNRLLYLHAAIQRPHAAAEQEIWKYTMSSELPATTAALYLQPRCQTKHGAELAGGAYSSEARASCVAMKAEPTYPKSAPMAYRGGL